MEKLSREDKVKVALLSSTNKIVLEVGKALDIKFEKEVINLIAELAWKKAKTVCEDAYLFSVHAKNTSICDEDVMLTARRNPSLKARFEEMVEEYEENDRLKALAEPLEETDVEAAKKARVPVTNMNPQIINEDPTPGTTKDDEIVLDSGDDEAFVEDD